MGLLFVNSEETGPHGVLGRERDLEVDRGDMGGIVNPEGVPGVRACNLRRLECEWYGVPASHTFKTFKNQQHWKLGSIEA